MIAQAVDSAMRETERQTLDLPAAGAALGFSEGTMRKLTKNGVAPAIRCGRRVVIPVWWVNEVLSGRRDLTTPFVPSNEDNR